MGLKCILPIQDTEPFIMDGSASKQNVGLKLQRRRPRGLKRRKRMNDDRCFMRQQDAKNLISHFARKFAEHKRHLYEWKRMVR